MSPIELLNAAAVLARESGLTGLANWLDGEALRIERPHIEALFIGPSGAGKTSSIVDLLGRSALGSDGQPLLPIEAAPSTAHLVEVLTGATCAEAEFAFADGRLETITDITRLRDALRHVDPEVRRVVVRVPVVESFPAELVLVDSPGVGSDASSSFEALVTEALGTADVVVLQVRATRGIGPVRKLLETLQSLLPRPRELARRLVLVLSDVRGEGRVEEIIEGVTALVGVAPAKVVRVSRRGDVTELRETLLALARSGRVTTTPSKRAQAIVGLIAIPVIDQHLQTLRARSRDADGERRFLERSVKEGADTIVALEQLAEDGRRRTLKALQAVVENTAQGLRDDSKALESSLERSVAESYRESFERSFTVKVQHSSMELHDTLDRELDSVVSDCDRLLEAFEQKIEPPPLDLVTPGFDELPGTVAKDIAHHAGRQAVRAIERMGGAGGAHMGLINVVRKGAAKYFRLVYGKKAPAELIRRGIPRMVKPLGKAMKFLAKRVWIIDVIVELSQLAWSAARAKAALRSFAETLITAWLEGPERSWWQWLKREPRPDGIVATVEKTVAEAWSDPESGISAQVARSRRSIEQQLDEMRAQLAALGDAQRLTLFGERLSTLQQHLKELSHEQ